MAKLRRFYDRLLPLLVALQIVVLGVAANDLVQTCKSAGNTLSSSVVRYR